MARAEPLKLKWITAIHNLFLCLLSLIMLIVIQIKKAGVVGAVDVYETGGFLDLYVMEPKYASGMMYWALYLFYLSKFPELIDTVILVLKKVTSS